MSVIPLLTVLPCSSTVTTTTTTEELHSGLSHIQELNNNYNTGDADSMAGTLGCLLPGLDMMEHAGGQNIGW